jgi:hypothetical protein
VLAAAELKAHPLRASRAMRSQFAGRDRLAERITK